MNEPAATKTVKVTFEFLVGEDIELDDIHSIIADAEVQIVEAVVRPEFDENASTIDAFAEFDVWTKLQETSITVDGEPV